MSGLSRTTASTSYKNTLPKNKPQQKIRTETARLPLFANPDFEPEPHSLKRKREEPDVQKICSEINSGISDKTYHINADFFKHIPDNLLENQEFLTNLQIIAQEKLSPFCSLYYLISGKENDIIAETKTLVAYKYFLRKLIGRPGNEWEDVVLKLLEKAKEKKQMNSVIEVLSNHEYFLVKLISQHSYFAKKIMRYLKHDISKNSDEMTKTIQTLFSHTNILLELIKEFQPDIILSIFAQGKGRMRETIQIIAKHHKTLMQRMNFQSDAKQRKALAHKLRDSVRLPSSCKSSEKIQKIDEAIETFLAAQLLEDMTANL